MGMQKKDTIVIIGNGFDIWQGLNTSYDKFQKYYLSHRDEILKKLKIKKITVKEGNNTYDISDVELIYGDPFDPDYLDDDFWNTFEASLDKLDAARLNFFFDKDKKGLKMMAKSIANANRILREAFCGWISTIAVDIKDSGLRFGENCIFINFNYTDTLEKRFGIDEADIIHIHGEASDAESIVFGHSSHPQEPERFLYKLGGRFRGLFLVESVLYETDKHVKDNITGLCVELSLSGVFADNIKDIYVLGHSLGEVDMEYFAFLKDASSIHEENEEEEEPDMDALDSLDELHNRIQYIIKRYGHDTTIDEPILPQEEAAIHRKFMLEQCERDMAIHKKFTKMMRKLAKKGGEDFSIGSDADIASGRLVSDARTEDARWHISYYSPADKKRAEQLMEKLGCKNYELFGSIDEAIDRLNFDIPL